MSYIDIEKLQTEIPKALENAEQGLPDEVFSFVASVTPMVNVDLFIQDEHGRILLAWRDDGKNYGWHVPGGIIRFKETFAERLQKTAMKELYTTITFDEEPLKITEIFMPYQRRGHFISFLYKCYLPKDYEIINLNKNTTDDGYLKWHDKLPILVDGQKCYEKFLSKLFMRR